MKQVALAAIFWAKALLPTNAQPVPFDLNDPVTLYAVMMFYDNTCGGLPPDAKIALFRWQIIMPAISMAIQLSVVQEFGRPVWAPEVLQQFGPDYGAVVTALERRRVSRSPAITDRRPESRGRASHRQGEVSA